RPTAPHSCASSTCARSRCSHSSRSASGWSRGRSRGRDPPSRWGAGEERPGADAENTNVYQPQLAVRTRIAGHVHISSVLLHTPQPATLRIEADRCALDTSAVRTPPFRLAVCTPAILAAALIGAKVVHASPGLPLVAADSAGADTTHLSATPVLTQVDTTRHLGVADTITVLPPVRVNGERATQSTRSSATSVHLDRSKIARFQPATVSDALLSTPGVYVTRTGPWASQVSMRGLSGERVLVLVDGLRLEMGRGHGAQTSLVSVDKLESVDVLPGAGGAVYGSDALGGVVELNTHKNLLTERSATILLTARSATPGEENSAMGRVRYTSPAFGAELSAGAGGLDALVTPDGRVPNSSYHEYDISGRATANLGASWLDFEHTQHETRDIGLPAFGDGAGSHAEFPLQARDANRLEWLMPAAGRRPEMRVL